MTDRISFLGAGNMATALARGLVAAGRPADQITASDPDAARRAAFAAAVPGARVVEKNAVAVAAARLVVLAVKPQVLPGVLAEVREGVASDHLLLSIAAGVPTARIEAAFAGPVRVVRAMPNTPALLGAGAAAVSAGRHARPGDLEAARRVLGAVGVVVEVPEALMDAVTAVSGSGPAYVFLLAEALRAAAIEQGLPPDVAGRLVAATVAGAGRMLLESGEDAETLRRRVTSPGGTTEAAVEVLFEHDLDDAISAAVAAAARRSAELGR